jgi:hypothetical protein
MKVVQELDDVDRKNLLVPVRRTGQLLYAAEAKLKVSIFDCLSVSHTGLIEHRLRMIEADHQALSRTSKAALESETGSASYFEDMVLWLNLQQVDGPTISVSI